MINYNETPMDENFMHTEETSEASPNKKILFGVALFVAIAGVVAAVYLLLGEKTDQTIVTFAEEEPNNEPPSSFEKVISDVGDGYVFELQYVPEALSAISIEVPSGDMLAADIADYESRAAAIAQVNTVFGQRDIAYALTFDDGVTFADFLATHANAGTFYQMNDELQFLASAIDAEFAGVPLAERSEVVELLVPIAQNPFAGNPEVVYPSQRATAGFYVTEIMSRVDPLNTEAYRAQGDAFAERGILYGQYGLSGVRAAKDLVTQYFALLDEADPELINSVTN